MLTEAANAPTLAAAAATFLVVSAQAIHVAIKGRKETREHRASSSTIQSIKTTIEDFVEEQRRTNEQFDKRITETDHIVRGVDGENGQRSKLTALELRVRSIEDGDRQRMLHGGMDRRTGT